MTHLCLNGFRWILLLAGFCALGTWIPAGEIDEAQTAFEQQADFKNAKALAKAYVGEKKAEEGLIFFNEQCPETIKAECEFARGDLLRSLYRWDEALEAYQSAFKGFRSSKQRKEEAACQSRIGRIYFAKGDYGQSREFLKKHRRLALKLGDREGAATALMNIASVKGTVGDTRGGLKANLQVLAEWEEAWSKKRKASLLNNLGVLNETLGHLDEAGDYYSQALELSEGLENEAGCAWTLNSLGSLSRKRGHFDKARRHFEASTRIRERLGDVKGLAYTYANLAAVADSVGDYERALAYYHKILPLAKQLGSRSHEASTRAGLGVVSTRLGDNDMARMYFKESLEQYKALGERKGVALCHLNLGGVCNLLGDYEASYAHYQKALELMDSQGNSRGRAAVLHNLGAHEHHQGRLEKAGPLYLQSLEAARETGLETQEITSLTSLSLWHAKKHESPEALDYARQALAGAKEVKSASLLQRAHRAMGRASWEAGQKEEALMHYGESIQLIESLRGMLEGENRRASYFGGKMTYYEDLVRLLLEDKSRSGADLEKALEISERMRSRVFLDALGRASSAREGVAPEVTQHRLRLQSRIRWLQSREKP